MHEIYPVTKKVIHYLPPRHAAKEEEDREEEHEEGGRNHNEPRGCGCTETDLQENELQSTAKQRLDDLMSDETLLETLIADGELNQLMTNWLKKLPDKVIEDLMNKEKKRTSTRSKEHR